MLLAVLLFLLFRTVTGIIEQRSDKSRHRIFFPGGRKELTGQIRKTALLPNPRCQLFVQNLRLQEPRVFLDEIAEFFHIPDMNPGPLEIPGHFSIFPQTQIYPSHRLSFRSLGERKRLFPKLMRRRIELSEPQILHVDSNRIHIRHIHAHADPSHPGRAFGQPF